MTNCTVYKKISRVIASITNRQDSGNEGTLGSANVKIVMKRESTVIVEIYSFEDQTEIVISLDNEMKVASVCHVIRKGKMEKFQDIFGTPIADTLAEAKVAYLDVVDWITSSNTKYVKHNLSL